MTPKYKVLFDLTQSSFPTSGIPQEARLMYQMLAKENKVTLSGLVLQPVYWPWMFSKKKDIDIAHFIYELGANPALSSKEESKAELRLINKIRYFLSKICYVLKLLNSKNYICHHVTSSYLKNALWSVLFSGSLPPSSRPLLLQTSIYVSDYPTSRIAFNPLIKNRITLNIPKNINFLVVHGYKKVNIKDKNTQIIHRYVDNIAFESPHTLKDDGTLFMVQKVLESFNQGSKIVVISNHVKEGLLKLNPKVQAENIFTIYPNIVTYKKNKVSDSQLITVIERNLSNFHKKLTHKDEITHKNFPYILAISTIEPRKNYTNLIKGWALYNQRTKNPVKLIIVGRFGWNCDDEKKLAEVYIKAGELIHLENVDREDLEILLSHAKMLPFLSFNEGFGAPPLEAMQCECPTLAADIDVFHEVYKDAALFCDPYDIEDIAAKMAMILNDSKESRNLRASLVEKGLKNVKRFSDEALMNKWMEMFEKLSTKKKE